jgi:hypothetical protein
MNQTDTMIALRNKLRPYAKAKRWNKCFCIGPHKTGTTTLNFVFNLLGYDCPDQSEIGISTVEQVQYGNYTELFRQVERYDFFQDSPFAQGFHWVALDSQFPGSKFIYTDRDADSWFSSLFRFHSKIADKHSIPVDTIRSKEFIERFPYLRQGYGLANTEYYCISKVGKYPSTCTETDWSLLYDEDHYKANYTKRRDDVIKYFARRESDLLVLDIAKSPDIGKIIEFLGMPSWINFSMPRLNSSAEGVGNDLAIKLLTQEMVSLMNA